MGQVLNRARCNVEDDEDDDQDEEDEMLHIKKGQEVWGYGTEVECGHDAGERACTDELIPDAFCGVHYIELDYKPSQQLPSLRCGSTVMSGPRQVIDVAFECVYQGVRKWGNSKGSAMFTAFLASPPLTSGQLAFTAGHCFSKPLTSLSVRNGFLIPPLSASRLRLPCSTSPVMAHASDSIACFHIPVSKSQFYLPCSPEEVPESEPLIYTFSYPGIDTFLYMAREELHEKKKKHGIWRRYKAVMKASGRNKDDLFNLFKQSFFQMFDTGMLVCSLGYLKTWSGPRLLMKTTAFPGCSGCPVVPVGLPGYFIATLVGGHKTKDFNFGTSTDAPEFVQAYKTFVLPHLPAWDSQEWGDRDTAPFKRWLAKHKILNYAYSN